MRLSWITAAAILISTQASAGVEQELLACAQKSDKLERLICFDALTETVKASQGSKAAAVTPVAVSAAPAVANTSPASTVPAPQAVVQSKSAEDEFGGNFKAEEQTIEKLYMEVASVKKDPYGALKLSFSNGQVWKQNDSRRFKLKVGETVYIEKAALGSYILGTDSRNATIRVKRIK
ncbi:hypothetical protein [uncultured Shewanella sp.]|uniref:hypothetical protein n=1 Tax=Shewanella atlantica TaxID=271099 RepID=UPI0026271672|nr:hypothetical protein [uncultured Shewanella sp.]